MRALRVGIIGAGRIGRVHAESIGRAGAQVVAISDPVEKSAKEACDQFNIDSWTTNEQDIFDNKEIEAVLICSPTNFHAKHITLAAEKGKHIFCEKPVDLDIKVVNQVVETVQNAGVKCMIGFNRRFDANAQRIRQSILTGEIGNLRLLRITSYDPVPPPIEYINVSGGMFTDMTSHDFDLARYLVDDEVDEVYAVANSHDPSIAKAGDIDTAMCLLTFKNGVIANIENSRMAAYGYDQRLEVLGSAGGASSENIRPNQVTISTEKAVYQEKPMSFFLERYMDAYVKEMHAFIHACQSNQDVQVGIQDGREALRLAMAANLSLREHRPVKMAEI